MGKAEENTGKERFSMQMNSLRRDLSSRFIFGDHCPAKLEERSYDDEEEEDIELSLGLSLNGRFGVDPKRAKKLTRSSSISNFIVTGDENKGPSAGGVPYAPLARTCSLPAETEEEWRKRKELQTLRRMEAKRKRMEKLKNVRVVREKGDWEDNCEDLQGLPAADGSGLPTAQTQTTSQVSVVSQGSGSSGVSDLENQAIQEMNKCPHVGSLQTRHLKVEQNPEVKTATTNGKSENVPRPVLEKLSTKVVAPDREGRKMLRNVMMDMPCVSTKGEGPHGKRIEGFLYRYSKGEEVKIVCVCHGSFLSPAEFVKHAGGSDVAHPLRHIVVNPSPFL